MRTDKTTAVEYAAGLPPNVAALLQADAKGEVDLMEAARAFARYAREHGSEIDLAVAGVLIRRAWRALAEESAAVRARWAPKEVETQEEPTPEDPWLTILETLAGEVDPGVMVGARIQRASPEEVRGFLIGEPLRSAPRAGRRVSLGELVRALEAAREEAAARARGAEVRRATVAARRQRSRAAVVEEDPMADVARVRAALPRGGHVVRLGELASSGAPVDRVAAMQAVLHLAKAGECVVWQEDFPVGPVYVRRVSS